MQSEDEIRKHFKDYNSLLELTNKKKAVLSKWKETKKRPVHVETVDTSNSLTQSPAMKTKTSVETRSKIEEWKKKKEAGKEEALKAQ